MFLFILLFKQKQNAVLTIPPPLPPMPQRSTDFSAFTASTQNGQMNNSNLMSHLQKNNSSSTALPPPLPPMPAVPLRTTTDFSVLTTTTVAPQLNMQRPQSLVAPNQVLTSNNNNGTHNVVPPVLPPRFNPFE